MRLLDVSMCCWILLHATFFLTSLALTLCRNILKTATSELRTLLEPFANGQSMDIIFNAANLINNAQRDEELRNWFKELNAYICKVRSSPHFYKSPPSRYAVLSVPVFFHFPFKSFGPCLDATIV